MTKMLSKLLAYLREGGDANIATISRKLDMEEGTIVMLFDQLVKLGYLEIIEDESDMPEVCNTTKCSGCVKLSSCESAMKAKYRLIK